METLLYLAKVNAYWLLFYTCYWLLLRKHTFFHWNRFYLLGTLLVAFALPAIRFTEPIKTIYVPETVYQKATISVAVIADHAPETGTSVWFWMGCIYMLVVLVMGWKFISGFIRLFLIVRSSETIDMGNYKLVMLSPNAATTNRSSFSFFRWLFLSDHDYRHNPDAIIRHEHEHIRQWHTVDIVLIELLKVCFWINPIIWLYKRSIETVHEYLADRPVSNRNDYASFLVAYAMKSPDIAIANHFFNSSLLNSRICMIYKKRSSRWLLTKYVLILPVLVCSIAISASRSPLPSVGRIDHTSEQNIRVKGNVTDENKEPIADAIVIIAGTTRGTTTDRNGWFELDNVPENAKLVITHVAYQTFEITVASTQPDLLVVMKKAVNQITGPVVVGKPVSTEAVAPTVTPHTSEHSDTKVVEQLPEFPGGKDAMMHYLMQNLQYPETARKINLEAVALISFTVDKNGEIRNARSVKNIGYGIDREALRVVNEMPKWNPAVQNGKPVETEYTLEVNFKIDKNEQEKRQGFLPTPTMEEIGSFLNGTLNLSKTGRVPDIAYGWSWNLLPRTPSMNATDNEQTSKYRYLNYSDADLKIKKPVWKYQKTN